jgi:hypothetical protein
MGTVTSQVQLSGVSSNTNYSFDPSKLLFLPVPPHSYDASSPTTCTYSNATVKCDDNTSLTECNLALDSQTGTYVDVQCQSNANNIEQMKRAAAKRGIKNYEVRSAVEEQSDEQTENGQPAYWLLILVIVILLVLVLISSRRQ